DELVASRIDSAELDAQLALRAVAVLGLERASVPKDFPVWLADRLRADGSERAVDRDLFAERRRATTEAQPAGVSRAQRRAARAPTQRTKQPGEALADGFFHGLGHGVGLEVHEAPGMGRLANKTLVAGDVVTVEPGLYRAGYGGVRLEDIVLATENGAEVITDYPYY